MWAVIPRDTLLGPATMSLSAPGGTENKDVVIVPTAIGVFTNNTYGSGPALAQVHREGAGLSTK